MTAGAIVPRELCSKDLGAVAALLRRVRGDNLFTERGVRHDIASEPERADAARWVVDCNGIVGYAVTMRYWWRRSNDAYAWVGVLPEARGRGIGAALATLVDRHVGELGVASVYTDVVDDAAGDAFVRSRSFRLDRVDRISMLDPRTVDLAELAPRQERATADGYDLVTLDEVSDLHGLYELALEAGDDTPGLGAPQSLSFTEWETSLLGFPDLHKGASAVIVKDGGPVSFALLSADLASRRARNEETATARAHRRRGLATLAKLAAIRWAREHGIEAILTDNAEANTGMLAINDRLGYRPLVERRRWIKRVSPG